MTHAATRRLTTSDVSGAMFLARHRVSLVVLQGRTAGSEYLLERESYVIGRGPNADILFADDTMSSNHAAIELSADGFKIRDMGTTNGTRVNGSRISAADLKHGDKIALGQHTLQYLEEKLDRAGSYDLSGEL